MSIRQGVFRVGETVEISAIFTDSNSEAATNIGNAKLFIKKPPPPNSTVSETVEMDIIPVDGVFSMDINPDIIGTWKIRFECNLPSPTAREAKFEVVDSMVTPVLPYSFY